LSEGKTQERRTKKVEAEGRRATKYRNKLRVGTTIRTGSKQEERD
jgi:hypothetical protein